MGFEPLAVCFYMPFNTVVLIFQASHGLGPIHPKDHSFQTLTHPFHSRPPCQINCGWKETGKRSFLGSGSLLMKWSSYWSLCNIYVTIRECFNWSQPFSRWQKTPNTPGLQLPEILISTAMLIGNFESYNPNISEDLRLAYMNFFACLPII